MTEHKPEDFLATGSHHAWTGEAANPVIHSGREPREGQDNWLERTPPANPRHAAITRSLYSWSNYKSWTDKVRNNWNKDKK
jgi:hypothetical protein